MSRLHGVGPRVAERLARLGVARCADLLCLLPVRYEDRTQVRSLGSLRPGEKVLVEGRVELAEVVFRRRRSLLCRIADGTGALTLRFFHFSETQRRSLARNARLRCYGEVRAGPTGLEMVHPEYRVIEGAAPPEARLTPVYPSTEGLHQQRLRQLVQQALALLEREPLPDLLADLLPSSWPGLNESIRYLHGPPPDAEIAVLASGGHPCQRRLALEEMIAQRLSLKRLGQGRASDRAPPLHDPQGLLAALRARLPFQLTPAQDRALGEILADLRRETPMHRLLQGDVGCGKTIVAALAALAAVSCGHQAALMAPTELLAEQHFLRFEEWLTPLGVRCVLLSGSSAGPARAQTLAEIATGDAHVVIGTHALFQQSVEFHGLALMIVDEQQRFGVEQRLQLRRKGERGGTSPHQLVMTATPIPRTLAMTAYADLDCSVIDALPPGRTPVRTVVMPESRRSALIERVLAHCAGGHQAYWVCPLIEESETIDSQAAEELARGLAEAMPQLSIGLIHGRMKPAEKDVTMRAFQAGRSDVLVATTVIEVGVDVPNASLMVIENAERMGLAQLHQLRGRVGRGATASVCVLLYKPPLSAVASQRLQVMRETNDGFRIAQKDLQLRGPGEVLGTRQTGLMQLKIADLVRDADLLPMVIEVSDRILEHDPVRVEPLVERWVSGGREYAKV